MDGLEKLPEINIFPDVSALTDQPKSSDVPPILFAHNTFPLASYLAMNPSNVFPKREALVRVVEPKIIEGLLNEPVINTFPFRSALMDKHESDFIPPALFAQRTFPFASYLKLLKI